MLAMTLPSAPNRVWLLSFWSSMSLLIGLITGMLLWMLISPLWSGLGVIVALALAGAGLLILRKLSTPYRAWNSLARRFARFAQSWVAAICFYAVFVAVGRAGASLKLARPDSDKGSLWVSRETLAPSAYPCPYKTTAKGPTQRNWTSTYLSWAVGSGSPWAACLLPFLILLRAFETEAEGDFPSNIYTLY